MIYFDNAASTPLSENVKNALINTIDDYFANPSSIHSLGERSKKLLEDSRKEFAKFFNVYSKQIIFTSGATESNNLALKSYLKTTSKKEIITSKIEHSSIIEVCNELENEGYIVKYVDTDEIGRVKIDSLKSLVNNNTAIVCLGVVNNEIGIIQDYKTISKVCRDNHVRFFSDAAQGLGHIDIDWSYFDFVTISSHKIHGPKGVGALILLNPDIKLVPQMNGGGQENGYRSGTENLNAIYAFSITLKEIDYSNSNKVLILKKRILGRLDSLKIKYQINSDIEHTSPYILSISFSGYDADTIVKSLSINGVCVSSASACLNNKDGYSYVIDSLYHSRSKSTIRISFSKYNTIEECDRFCDVLSLLLNTIERNNSDE